MKYLIRILIFSLLISILLPVFPASAQYDPGMGPVWLPANPESKPESPAQTEVENIDSHTLDVSITFSGVWAQVQTGEGHSYTRLWHEDYSSYREPGQPALPGVTFNILIPQGAQVEVIQQKASSHRISLLRQALPSKIIPAQRQASKSEPPPAWTPPDPVPYASRDLDPQNWYEVNDTFQMRDYTILPIWINPVRYRPTNGDIELLEKIELRLTWPELSADVLDTAVVSDSPSFDRLVSQIVINPPLPATLDGITPSGEGYLIITPDEFVEELALFETMKISQGYAVDITLLSEIPGFIGIAGNEDNNILAIQNYIKSLNPSPVYLLLVGDTNFIPAPNGLITGRKTDLYYATIDESLEGEAYYVPDIFVGRLPARTQEEVSTIVAKMIAYTTGGYQPWHSNSSFIATCDNKYDHIATGSHNYVISNYTSPYGFVGDYPETPMAGGDQLYCVVDNQLVQDIKTSIISSLNKGRGMIIYSGHGSPLGWYDGYISILNGDVVSLNVSNVYSFIASFSCETNDFGSTTNIVGFGETWMIQANKGAIAFIGSAAPSYWGPDDVLERNSNDIIFSNPLASIPLRNALFFGLTKVQDFYPGIDAGEAQYYWETYNLLGDPSQQLWLVPDYKYEANATTLAKSGLLNSTVRYPIEITNLGNTDSFTASFEGNLWPTDIDELANLPYQSTGTLWVNVTIPLDIVVNEEAFDVVSVTVSSISEPTLTASFTITTTALETFFTRLPVMMK